MEERKLARIEKIVDIQPIENADKIVVATILGWKCVVNKEENHKIDDFCCYIEVDSVLPKIEQFEFLSSRKYRIKTIKLRNQISQGLVLSLSVLKEILGDKFSKVKLQEGFDLTDLLNIKKYLSVSEQEEFDAVRTPKNKYLKYLLKYKWFRYFYFKFKKSKQKGFPSWVTKTDEPRIQNMQQVIKQYENEIVEITEKVDYQSLTVTGKKRLNGVEVIVCSRNLINDDKNSLYWRIVYQYKIDKIIKENPNLTIQGEQGSTNVQKNKYGISEPRLWIFNIVDNSTKKVYTYSEMVDFAVKYNLEIVPLIAIGKLSDFIKTSDEAIEMSKGKSVINNRTEREGLVFKIVKDGKKLISFKAINPNFLLKNDE